MSERVYSDTDPIYQRFMERQFAEGMALAEASDILRLHVPPLAPPHFVAEFLCKGLIKEQNGEIKEANSFQIGVWFPSDYLRRANCFYILRAFTPNIWHPNISYDLPLICIGRTTPGMPLVDILYQIFEILCYQRYTPREDNCLNHVACAWAREHEDSFPTDHRPLKRRPLRLEVQAL